jgi:7-cyano-7-deazaguanine reductase
MSRSTEELAGLGQLGSQSTAYEFQYAPEVLERFANKHPSNDYVVMLNCPEFTSLCPKTGQPDFAELRIAYIPDQYLVESKSLKLYLFSFRNHGDFHEDCCNIILKDLVALLEPRYMEVTGLFMPRGGISLYPFVNYAKPDGGYEDYAKSRLFAAIDRRTWK